MPENTPQPPEPPGPPPQRARRWKRTATAALLLLAGGAVVNVAVAWGIAYGATQDQQPQPYDWKYFDDVSPSHTWFVRLRQSPGWQFAITLVGGNDDADYLAWLTRQRESFIDGLAAYVVPSRLDTLPRWCFGPAMSDNPPVHRATCSAAYGWPFLSLSMRYEQQLPVSAAGTPFEFVGAIPVESATAFPQYWRKPRALPLLPVLPGFAINTLLYALLLWGLIASPFAARRALRRKRRLCERCGYPIGVSPVCTECGAAIRLGGTGASPVSDAHGRDARATVE